MNPQQTEVLTAAEACELLHICADTLTKLKRLQVRPLPFLKVGRRHLYEREAILAWARRNGEIEQRRLVPRYDWDRRTGKAYEG